MFLWIVAESSFEESHEFTNFFIQNWLDPILLRFWKPFDPWRYLRLFLQRPSTPRPCKLLGMRLQFHRKMMKSRHQLLPANANVKVLSHGITMQSGANGSTSVGLTMGCLSKMLKACGRHVMPSATIWKMFPYKSLSVENLSQRVRPKIHGRIRYPFVFLWQCDHGQGDAGALQHDMKKGNIFRASACWFYLHWFFVETEKFMAVDANCECK